ncbi:MAG: IS3 family transposase [Gemmatimonadales bacterium]|nr:IS3 family transposase [Gemmatimonadales bacterium]
MVARHRAEYLLTLMCRVLGIARSAFYVWQHRGPSAHAQTDAALRLRIAPPHERSDRNYGSPRIVRDLRDEQCFVSRRRVARLMGELGLDDTPQPRFVVTTRPDAALPVAPNLLDRHFAVDAPNRVWAADVTYCRTGEGWLYLAVVLDLCSRCVVGHESSRGLLGQCGGGEFLRDAQAGICTATSLAHAGESAARAGALSRWVV